MAVHDPPAWTIPPAQVARIAAALPDDTVVDARAADDRAREFPHADIIVTTRLSPDEARLAGRVRWIQTTAVGTGGLLRPGIAEGPAVITNARGVHAEAIAEHALALLLALRRGLHVAAARQAAGEWAQLELSVRRVRPLAATRLLVVGLGEIGGRVARLAAALGMTVTGVRRRPGAGAPPGVARVVGPEGFAGALPEADAVILAAPSTSDAPWLGPDEIARLPAGALVINVARGKLIDDAALLDALRSGRIGGAGLDAFRREPLPADSPWWRAPNVLVTPHTAAFDGDYWTPVVDLFLDNVARFRRGAPLRNVVDKTRGY